jgi:CRISPR-associated protein Csm2
LATNYQHDRGRGGYQQAQPELDTSDIVLIGDLNPEIFADVASKKAFEVSQSPDQHANRSSQLRRFYDELVMWQERVGSDSGKFKHFHPFINMLKAKVAYSRGRKHVDASFEKMFCHVINQCKDAESLRNAKLFMEAFLAFYKVHKPN